MEILQAPDLEKIAQDLQALLERGIDSIAVVCLHAYLYPDHEEQIGELAQKMGFSQVSLSSAVMPMAKIVARGDTTVVDSYLTPHIRHYIENFKQGFRGNLAGSRLLFMRSDGGLASAERFNGSKAILSGPAGGVVGYAMTAFDQENPRPIIGFDMGGTSTDVSRFGGAYEIVHETETAGVRIQAPQLDIITVAAGGGSRLFFKNGMLQVGPESAGAHPGPLCYRKGGYLSVTDANLVLGRILPEYFPKIFGPSGDQPLDREAAFKGFKGVQQEINQHRAGQNLAPMSIEEVAAGFIQVANEAMARPMREISVARGYDIKEHVLACFGGAGGQHACAIARRLGIGVIHIHRFAGILSAYGLGMADVVEDRQEPAGLEYDGESSPARISERLTDLGDQVGEALKSQGFADDQIDLHPFLNLRYQGTDTALMIEAPADGDFLAAFRRRHQREFGFELAARVVLVDDIRVRGVGGTPHFKKLTIPTKSRPAAPTTRISCYLNGGWHDAPVYRFNELGAGETIVGPAIIIHDTSTIVVEPAAIARTTGNGDLLIHLEEQEAARLSTDCDPVQLAIFSNLFMSIAEQMGRTLQRTAISTNIKERLDFSCAVFDATGGLVANAPHQPVHLGAMSEAVRQQVKLQGKGLQKGDVLITNHPVTGGSHLPDITVITPFFRAGKPLFFVANRGHHADIGGSTPGSMPPFSRTLAEEGACIKSFKLVENGIFQETAIVKLLAGARSPSDNLSDLKAQVAANRKGIGLLREMVDRYSLMVVQAYMGHIQENAESAVRHLLCDFASRQERRVFEAIDYLDDGSPIALKLTIDPQSGEALFDFSETGDQLPGNLNAPRAVTHSAILYSLRCLISQEIPLNQGCLKPITIRIRPGSLLAPSEEAAVVGGNVLTSQRLVDVILKAFGAAAGSQGCMNNLTFGNQQFGYYETIGGGAGAGPDWPGQSGVHTHMTNTRITDPEILERRYPVILREFAIRKGSGGAGRFRGGDGLVRELEFLAPLTVALLTERRVYAPYGLAGGEDGRRGENLLLKKNGQVDSLGGKHQIEVEPGDRIRILTPGGGGYGKD